MKNKTNLFSFLFGMLLVVSFSYGQTNSNSSTKIKWKGFERLHFKFEGREAFITTPKKALVGKPWVWRGHFPEYHAGIDSLLLAKGFHIAYVNTNDLYGSPTATAVWNTFYQYVTTNYHLQAKVALHGHSRGGLYIYNWAKQNAEKIACIYGDAVVCDFKSWPGGFGSSAGSKKDWAVLKSVYGFKTDDEAKAYKDNPIDNLDKLVQAGVPILHTISLKDAVVPPEENSLLLVNNYIRLGGTATVSPCRSGIQKSKGHHYDIDNPEMVVDFIVKQCTEINLKK